MVLNQNPKQKVHTNTKNYFDQSENLRATATPCFEYKTLVATIKKKKIHKNRRGICASGKCLRKNIYLTIELKRCSAVRLRCAYTYIHNTYILIY